ncbi:hypothetical protein TPHA_0G00580 [Tetrapisispora phaffii CBS 4417]|uniref:Phosphomevalonate kinase n=1 Tax=Tetrapisispora phaffii (strain ATCC 24235 / CBS 4417 / NBRC 1672 / NRRL Y-8282 / UCD 70-5) TaxID=1071381 RepID=G8BVG6_TETPH|nr:hypothetical protein TPHA_0G00580 [Tetrapisispora phaffii CBS 4417]CCE63894.1 hypothetical protein TPHA_0G00580 [Tetrapisispora phaffii CBS 4417]
MVNGSKAFSAPGKAMLAGGYLVLDPKYISYVIALSSRMHSVVNTTSLEDKVDANKIHVTVSSSQFNNDQWVFDMKYLNGGFFPEEVNGLKNPFLKMALFNVFNYFKPTLSATPDINIEIFSDAGYHSQNDSDIKRNQFKHFNFHKNTITEVPKTGLGSSAGLVTVVTTALISVFNNSLDVTSAKDLNQIHNLTQVAHCQAQGKVGSGFDVAAATYGSIVYRRFVQELITNLPETFQGDDLKDYQEALTKLVDNTDWGIKNDVIRLPHGLRLIMGDVNSGSETPKLVAKVKQWYESNLPRSLEIYTKIDEGNRNFIKFITELNELHDNDETKYKALIKTLETDHENVMSHPEFANIKNAVSVIRENFRLITKESGADIEPEVQTQLLDKCLTLKGVLTGMVPGAGGYDAISLLTTVDTDLKKQTYGNLEFQNVTWLDLEQADVGVVEENPEHYKNFI